MNVNLLNFIFYELNFELVCVKCELAQHWHCHISYLTLIFFLCFYLSKVHTSESCEHYVHIHLARPEGLRDPVEEYHFSGIQTNKTLSDPIVEF